MQAVGNGLCKACAAPAASRLTAGPRDLFTFLRLVARDRPTAPAVLAPGRRALTYVDLCASLDYIATALGHAGFRRGDRVAVALPQGPEAAVVTLAVAAAASCVPLNPAGRLAEHMAYLAEVEARGVVVPAGEDSPAARAARALGLAVLEVVGHPEAAAGQAELRATVTPTAWPQDTRAGTRAAVALLLPTSGTTSRPKRVPLTNANLAASAASITATLKLSPSDRSLVVMPLFHIHGLMMLMATLASGGSAACPPAFEPARFGAWLDELAPSWYSAVPAMHHAVVTLTGLDRAPHGHPLLRFVRSATGPLPQRLGRELEALLAAPVNEADGMTEAAHQIASNPLPPGLRRPGSVGLPTGTEIVVLDEGGRPLAADTVGEVAIRGDGVTPGYEDMADSREGFADGWLRTGDLGRVDTDGYLWLTGRLKEQVNRGGHKIAPREVEEVLGAHPAVEEVAVFPLPHPTLGEDIAAAVVRRPAAQASAQALRAYVRERLADYKVPGLLHFVDRLPIGPTGKIQRARIAQQLGLPKLATPVSGDTPAGRTEVLLAGIWSDVLRCPVGRHDDFFALGGDSLHAALIAARAGAALGVVLGLQSVLEQSTVAALAAALEAAPGGGPEGSVDRLAGALVDLPEAEQRRLLADLDGAPG